MKNLISFKIKDEVVAVDYIHAIIVPEKERNRIELYVPEALNGLSRQRKY